MLIAVHPICLSIDPSIYSIVKYNWQIGRQRAPRKEPSVKNCKLNCCSFVSAPCLLVCLSVWPASKPPTHCTGNSFLLVVMESPWMQLQLKVKTRNLAMISLARGHAVINKCNYWIIKYSPPTITRNCNNFPDPTHQSMWRINSWSGFCCCRCWRRSSSLDSVVLTMTTTRQTGIAINIILSHKPCTRSFFSGQGLAHKLGTMMINSDDSFVPLLIPNPQEQPRQLYAEYTQAWRHWTKHRQLPVGRREIQSAPAVRIGLRTRKQNLLVYGTACLAFRWLPIRARDHANQHFLFPNRHSSPNAALCGA